MKRTVSAVLEQRAPRELTFIGLFIPNATIIEVAGNFSVEWFARLSNAHELLWIPRAGCVEETRRHGKPDAHARAALSVRQPCTVGVCCAFLGTKVTAYARYAQFCSCFPTAFGNVHAKFLFILSTPSLGTLAILPGAVVGNVCIAGLLGCVLTLELGIALTLPCIEVPRASWLIHAGIDCTDRRAFAGIALATAP